MGATISPGTVGDREGPDGAGEDRRPGRPFSVRIHWVGRGGAPFKERRDPDGDTGSFPGYRVVNAG
ncbi:hypothetical protein HMPREF9154_2729 [Arachnia propionica F0230a]|nr:hypothetical protein HMPREF9154_2729 [Arachnia propionica F0230a]